MTPEQRLFSPELIIVTIAGLEARLQEIPKEQARLQEEIVKLTKTIEEWRAVLSALPSLNGNHGATYRKRGYVREVIQAWVQDNPQDLFTIPEIVQGTGLPNASVHNLMTKKDGEYEKDTKTGKWKVRTS